MLHGSSDGGIDGLACAAARRLVLAGLDGLSTTGCESSALQGFVSSAASMCHFVSSIDSRQAALGYRIYLRSVKGGWKRGMENGRPLSHRSVDAAQLHSVCGCVGDPERAADQHDGAVHADRAELVAC